MKTSPIPLYDQYYLPDPEGAGEAQNDAEVQDSIISNGGSYQSSNYVPNTSGWFLGSTFGEFNFAVSVDSLDIPDTVTANSFHVDSSGNAWWGATTFAGAPGKVSNAGAATFSSMTITGGSISGTPISSIPNNSSTDISLLGWQSDLTFSSTDFNTAAWTSGTITLSNGRTFSISSGNTGNMAALTYIYLDTAVSTTVLQTTTTAATAIGANKILVAVAQNNSDSSGKVWMQAFGGKGGIFLAVDNLSANSASTNEFVANTANIKDAVITNAKVVSLAVDKLTAGTISSKSIVLAITPGTGDSEIRAGIATGDFDNAGAANGFIMGLDDSDSDKVKFYFGNATRYVKFDGTDLTVNGYVVTGKGSFGGDGSDGALSITSGTTTLSASSALRLIKNYTSISITSTGALTFSNPHTNGTIFILKSQGAVTVTSSASNTISTKGLGGASDSIGAATSVYPSVADSGGDPGGAGTARGAGLAFLIPAGGAVQLACGAGGGTGGSSFFGGSGGAGGRGGGALYIECGGALNFGASSTINAGGDNGSNGSNSNNGGGGGGGGGTVVILYASLTANSGTISATGGTGGTGQASGGSGGTGADSGGSLANGGGGGGSAHVDYGQGGGGGGGNGGSAGSSGGTSGSTAGGGGGGGGGSWLVAENTVLT